MKILMITEKDAANVSLAYVVQAFEIRKDEVIIYAPYCDASVLRCFDASIPKLPIGELTEEKIAWCDLIFCSTLSSIYLPVIVFTAKKPIFTHNYLMNRQINWGGDICFAPTRKTVASDYDEYMNYSYIGIGEPKYDYIEKSASSDKRFLFIDSGHYPFSKEGKKELARILIDICRKYPDYELWVKPRFLPNDTVMTHRNVIHLYNVIQNESNGNIPKNMVLLNYHEDLMKLIHQSTTVICMYTTAFVGAVVAGKGLIIIDNLPSADVYDIRHKTYMRARENMVALGALIDYRNIEQLLPDGVKGTDEYLDFLLEEKEHVADKICEVCEYLWREYYSKNKFPQKRNSTYRNYKNDYMPDKDMTWERKISQRFQDYILFKSLILIDFHVKEKLDIGYVFEKAKDCSDENGIIQEDTFRNFLGNVNYIRDSCIIKNREILLRDKIDSGILLNAYYLRKKFDEIRKFPVTDIAAYDLYRAFVAFDENNTSLAKMHFIRYFNQSMEREYNLEISDMPNNKFKAFETLIGILCQENEAESVRYYYSALLNYYSEFYVLSETDILPFDSQQKKRYDFICGIRTWLNGERNIEQ